MPDPSISIHLAADAPAYGPGALLIGSYELRDVPTEEVRAVECSVLWHTLGKGEEDLAVIHFQRDVYDGDADVTQLPREPHEFRCELPAAPLSYDGVIVKVLWCVRVRAFLARGQEYVEELPFRVGDVAPAHWIDSDREELPASDTSG